MKNIFTETQERLRSSAYKNEEHVRLSLVARIVQALGWDIWNPAEVNTEFIAIPHEDKTRVDMALFLPPWKIPSVFIEIKAVGKMLPNLSEIEKQTRDYNRNNTALISIITDGQLWKFYLSQTGGEFSQKRFLDLDLLKNGQNIDELESEFRKFLSSNAIESGDAVQQAVHYLKRSRKVKAMEEVYLDAIEASKHDPATTLAAHLVQLVADRGEQITFEEAVEFIKSKSRQHPIIPPARVVTSLPPSEPGPTIPEPPRTLSLSTRNGTAYGHSLSGKYFVVHKGSHAVLNHCSGLQDNNKEIRRDLLSLGVFVQEGESLVLTKDHTFNTISQAASVLLGRSANGKIEWR